jgi:hypothetical protein
MVVPFGPRETFTPFGFAGPTGAGVVVVVVVVVVGGVGAV